MKLALFYGLFALLATFANIVTQDVVVHLYSGSFDLFYSIVAGTIIGLLVKYVLDKRYIFRFQANNLVHDGQTFMLYSLMGILTTIVFWGFEFGFDYLFKTKELRYLGGVLGLSVGYLMKYHLDKRFVFRRL